jgi:hypothetical protein
MQLIANAVASGPTIHACYGSLFAEEASDAAEQRHIRVVVRIRPPIPAANKTGGVARHCLRRHSSSVIAYDGPKYTRSLSPPQGRTPEVPSGGTPQTPARPESAHTSPPRSSASASGALGVSDSGGAAYRTESGQLHPSHTRGHRGTWFGTYSPTTIARGGGDGGGGSPSSELDTPTRSSPPEAAAAAGAIGPFAKQFRFDQVRLVGLVQRCLLHAVCHVVHVAAWRFVVLRVACSQSVVRVVCRGMVHVACCMLHVDPILRSADPAWGVVRGAWCVVRGAWCVVRVACHMVAFVACRMLYFRWFTLQLCGRLLLHVATSTRSCGRWTGHVAPRALHGACAYVAW